MEMSRGQQRPVCRAPSRAGSPCAHRGSKSRVRARPHRRGIRASCFSERLSDPNPLRILPGAGSRLVCAHHPPPGAHTFLCARGCRNCRLRGLATSSLPPVSGEEAHGRCSRGLGRVRQTIHDAVPIVVQGAVNGAGGSLHTASWGRSHRQERPMWDPRARNGCERLEGASIKRGHQSGTGDPPHTRDHMTHVTCTTTCRRAPDRSDRSHVVLPFGPLARRVRLPSSFLRGLPSPSRPIGS